MLQQILRDMYIEPELLAELSEEQKQILFVKMREEQVRRWKEKEKEYEENLHKHAKKSQKKGGKKVNFLHGRNGKEWVWVMGDHPDDKTIQQIIEEEAQKKALLEAEKEALELKTKEENIWKRKLEEEQRQLAKEKEEAEMLMRRKKEEAALYQSIKEAQRIAKQLEEEKKEKELAERKKLEELKVATEQKRRRSVEKYDQVRNRRSTEIYIQWKEMRNELEKTAEEGSHEIEGTWKERERKSKEAEIKMRELARNARKEYQASLRRTNQLIQAAKAFSQVETAVPPSEKPPIPPKKHLMTSKNSSIKRWTNRPSRPPSRAAVVSWFKQDERPRGAGHDTNDRIAPWFHGIISRAEAERLLSPTDSGSFLVRVSERVWGYTLSYHGEDRIKHFLIDTTEGGYQFLGASQVQHASLADLVEFHKENVITISGGEKLISECGQSGQPPDYQELFQHDRSDSTSL